jgi:metallo-beta-lactamase family protein
MPKDVGHADWHNEYQSTVLDLRERLDQAADSKGRAVILRRVKRALEQQAS